ncbi:MAG: DMT family transporter [Microbacteriaceae bacterium]|nr:DMT family transporter [Microbacteriaceae bacterium]
MTTHSQPHLPVWVALVGSALAGTLVSLQSRINGGLSGELGNAYVTAAVSFGSGLIILCVVILVSRGGRRGLVRLRAEVAGHRLPPWALLGGTFGALFVLSQGLIATVTGLALFTVSIVAGQVFGGLIMDRIGLGPGGRVIPTPTRLIGTGLAIVAVGLSVFAGGTDGLTGSPGGALEWRHLVLIVIPVLVGVGISFQSAVNGLVRAASRSTLTSTFVNFVVGTVILVIAAVISVAAQGWPEAWPTNPVYYIGGAVGTIFIAAAAMLVRTAGVLLLSMSNVAGQLVASTAFEAGLPLAGGVTAGMLAGVAVALVAVIVAALPSRR